MAIGCNWLICTSETIIVQVFVYLAVKTFLVRLIFVGLVNLSVNYRLTIYDAIEIGTGQIKIIIGPMQSHCKRQRKTDHYSCPRRALTSAGSLIL